jgi:hypothetical protein
MMIEPSMEEIVRYAAPPSWTGGLMPNFDAGGTPGPSLPMTDMTLWVNGRVGITTGSTFTWADQSGSGLGDFSASAANRPSNGGSINSLNAVTFTAGQHLANSIATLFGAYIDASTKEWTMAAAFQTTWVGAGLSPVTFPQFAPQIFGGSNTTTAEWTGLGAQVDPVAGVDLYVYSAQKDSSTQKVATDLSAPIGSPHYIIGMFDGSDLYIAVDGGSFSTSPAGVSTNTIDSPFIGGLGASSAQRWQGVLGELVCWKTAQSSPNLTQIATFLSTTWSI